MYEILINIDQRRSLIYITIYTYTTVFGACTSFSLKIVLLHEDIGLLNDTKM